jgi:hypothetical protein
MNLASVYEAIKGALPTGIRVWDSEVIGPHPVLPWLVLDRIHPEGWVRAQTGARHATTLPVLVTVAAASPSGRHLWVGRVLESVDLAVIHPTGWGEGQIRHQGEVTWFRDPQVKDPHTGIDVYVAKISFQVTLSEENTQ